VSPLEKERYRGLLLKITPLKLIRQIYTEVLYSWQYDKKRRKYHGR
jgi:hypothetical protein